jgi:multiple sugar transport system ATP-binding protein
MVFQSYALYPHMTVYDNLAFGLKIRHINKEEIRERVYRAAKILEIEKLLDRKPKQLSGGQRQRVALGRAIVRNAKVFLMDEPLSNLDAKLRVQMRAEIIKLHENIGATTIYVTHDQTEAMTMASRIVVMKGGYIMQIGSPIEIYNNPANLFVAAFIGSPAMNLMDVKYSDGKIHFADGLKIEMPEKIKKALTSFQGKEVVFGIRPEDSHRDDAALAAKFPSAVLKSTIKVAELLGHEYIVHTDLAGNNLISKIDALQTFRIGDPITLTLNLEKAHIFDKESQKTIY